MHFCRAASTVVAAWIIVGTFAVPAGAEPPKVESRTGGQATADTAGVQASYKRRVESVEFNTRPVSTVLTGTGRGGAGSPAAGGSSTRRSSSSTLPGCYNHVVSSGSGQLTYGHICPGRGGYEGGTAAELFGISEIVLRDPVTGQVTGTIPATGLTTGTATTVTVTSAQLAEFALAGLALPSPVTGTSPAGDHIAQLPSWLWIDPAQYTPQERTATAGPVSATVTATPVRVAWDMGNGDVVTCNGPGRVYAPRFAGRPEASDCTYTYRHSSANQPDTRYPITTTIAWDVGWTGSDGNGGDFGELTSSTTDAVRVAEVQALVQ